VHERISVSDRCTPRNTLHADFELWHELGVHTVSLTSPKVTPVGWEESAALATASGLRVCTVFGRLDLMGELIEFAAAVGADCVWTSTGGGVTLGWDNATQRFYEAIAPHQKRAKELGVVVAIEPTNPLRADLSFTFTARDAVEMARAADLGVVVDFFSTWYERDLDELFKDHVTSSRSSR
jgi:sugar phosphate isomerase/epimerase